jgi:hypothetical protein
MWGIRVVSGKGRHEGQEASYTGHHVGRTRFPRSKGNETWSSSLSIPAPNFPRHGNSWIKDQCRSVGSISHGLFPRLLHWAKMYSSSRNNYNKSSYNPTIYKPMVQQVPMHSTSILPVGVVVWSTRDTLTPGESITTF